MAIAALVEPREIVKANNELFRARCKIRDVLAGRIFMAFASLVDEKDIKENQNFVEYNISASAIFNSIDAGGDNYRQIREAAYSLVDQKLERKIGKNGFEVYTLFSKIKYNEGIITGEFHKDLVPFFIAAAGIFTRIYLQQYMKLPSIYSQKLFTFLKSWDDKPEIEKNLGELHEMLDTPESFRSDFRQFRTRVLEKAHKDITKQTNLRFEWEPIKKGRAVIAVRFIFSWNRASPVAKKKAEGTNEKQSQRNNAAAVTAMNCFKERGETCQGGHQKKTICGICLKFRPQESCQK